MKESDAVRLWKAVQKDDLKTIKLLVASADAKRDRDTLNRALSTAVFRRRAEIADLVLSAGASPEQTTSIGTLLMCAGMNGDLPIVKRLIAAGANFNREVKSETALSACPAWTANYCHFNR